VGYAVFDDTGVHVLVVSGGFGHGIAHDNKSGKETYLRVLNSHPEAIRKTSSLSRSCLLAMNFAKLWQ
jgi:hypothetical protein